MRGSLSCALRALLGTRHCSACAMCDTRDRTVQSEQQSRAEPLWKGAAGICGEEGATRVRRSSQRANTGREKRASVTLCARTWREPRTSEAKQWLRGSATNQPSVWVAASQGEREETAAQDSIKRTDACFRQASVTLNKSSCTLCILSKRSCLTPKPLHDQRSPSRKRDERSDARAL